MAGAISNMSENVTFTVPDLDSGLTPLLRSLELKVYRARRAVMPQPEITRDWYNQPLPLLGYAAEGESRISLRSSRSPVHLLKGICLYMPGGLECRTKRIMTGPTFIREFIHFDLTVLGGVSLLPFFRIPYLIDGDDSNWLRGFIQHQIKRGSEAKTGVTLGTAAGDMGDTYELVEVLLRKAVPTPHWDRFLKGRLRLQCVLEYIGEHLCEPLNIEELAGVAAMSPSTLTRAFRAAVGRTPLAHVRRLRMERAQHLLLTSEMSLEAVATDLGYADAFSFSKAFRRETGVSPGRARWLPLDGE
jgi:AraC-like DNA-binding protein